MENGIYNSEDNRTDVLLEEDSESRWLKNPLVPTREYMDELACFLEISQVRVGGKFAPGPRYSVYKLIIDDDRTRKLIIDSGLACEIRTGYADEVHECDDDEEYMLINREEAVKILRQEKIRRCETE